MMSCAVALFVASTASSAQPSLDERYQQAVALFNQADMEGACELLKEIEQESSGYREVRTYLNPSCAAAKRLYDREEKLFNEGLQAFNQQRYDEAKQEFEQALAKSNAVRHPKYKAQITDYLGRIEARSTEERLFQDGVVLFNQTKYIEARNKFNLVVVGGGSRAPDARGYLAKIASAMSTQRASEETTRLFDEGVRLFHLGHYAEARARMNQVIQTGGTRAAEARDYLSQIAEAERTQRSAGESARLFEDGLRLFKAKQYPEARIRLGLVVRMGGAKAGEARTLLGEIDKADQARRVQTPPATTTGSSALEQPLRAGLRAYFNGRYDEAEQDLTDYLNHQGSKRALSYFFRGACRSALYFLSGEKDSQQKELALVDFRTVKEVSPQFQPPRQYVSPKILALYAETRALGPQ